MLLSFTLEDDNNLVLPEVQQSSSFGSLRSPQDDKAGAECSPQDDKAGAECSPQDDKAGAECSPQDDSCREGVWLLAHSFP